MKKAIIGIFFLLIAVIFMVGVYISMKSVSSGSNYNPEQAVIDKLEKAKVVIDGDLQRFGSARKQVVGENRILYITGSPYEMGYQQGVHLKNEIRNGVVPVFADPVSGSQDHFKKPGWLRKIMLKYLELTIYGPLERTTPKQYLEELKGIADGADIDYPTIFIANFLSDFNMSMIPGVIEGQAAKFEEMLSCSSFVASGTATSSGRLIFGRNTDYSGQGRWSRNQVIIYYDPSDGNRYVKISSAGMIKCNSAMNEHGIVIGGHFMGFSDAAPEGASFTVLENEIMRRAGSLEEAIKLVETTKRGGAFGLTIAEGKTGQAVALEASPERLGIRTMHKHSLVMTNYALTKELEEVDLLTHYSLMMRNVKGRDLRFQQLIEENFGQITPEKAAAFMGDHIDSFLLQERGTGNTICNQTNVTSAVFQPETGRFWVATGDEPACGNPYQAYDFSSGFQNGAVNPINSTLSGYIWQDEGRKQGLGYYMKAIVTWNDDLGNLVPVLKNIEAAVATDPSEPIYSKNLARILVHQGQYREAIQVLTPFIEKAIVPNEKALALLLIAQAYDLLGDRDNALEFYRMVTHLNNNDKMSDHAIRLNHFVNTYAEAGLKSPFEEKQLNDIPIISEFLD